jgi:ribosomal protein S27AE
MNIVHDTILQLREIQATGHVADKAAERILYNGKALIEKLFNGEVVTTDVRAESETAGAAAAAEGKEYYGCSGASGAFAEQSAQLSHELTFGMLNGMEGVAIERCPQCGASCIVAIRDKKTGRYSCINKSCTGYNKSMVDAANGIKGTKAQQSFTDAVGDLLADLFSTKKDN